MSDDDDTTEEFVAEHDPNISNAHHHNHQRHIPFPGFGSIPPPMLQGHGGPWPPNVGQHGMMRANMEHMNMQHGGPLLPPPHHHHQNMSGLHGHPVIPGMLPPLQQIVMPNPIDPAEAMLGVFPCAKVRGMPYLSSIEDVLIFFSGLVLIDVVFNRHNEQQGAAVQSHQQQGDNVEAFCVFGNHMDFQMALQRDRQMMGNHRCVEVHQGKRSEYYEAIVSCQSRHGTRTNTRDEIADVTGELQNMNISPWNIHVNSPTPAPIGAPSQLQNQHKRGNRGNNQRGSGTSQLSSSSQSRGGHTHTRGGIQEGEHTGILRMRGLPFNATDGDVLQFFEDYKLLKDSSVVFTFRNDGRPSGEAYVKFESAEDSKRAMSLNRQSMGSRYVELFIASEDEHARSVARLKILR